jgi:hypothetical protein
MRPAVRSLAGIHDHRAATVILDCRDEPGK